MSAVRGRTCLATARVWLHVSAKDRPLGRLAANIATILMGKHKPHFHPGADYGDYVVVTDCEHLKITGRKMDQHKYYSHSTMPGHLKAITMRRLKEKFGASEILRRAVRGMLPKNRLRAVRLERLKPFDGKGHPYRKNLLKLEMPRTDSELDSPKWSSQKRTIENNIYKFEKAKAIDILKYI